MATVYPINKIVLFEFDEPVLIENFLSAEAGIWSWVITNTVVIITDDNGGTGYYSQQDIIYKVKSFTVDNVAYAAVTNLANCRITNKSFFYDETLKKIYVHFEDFEPPLGQSISFGGATGFSKMPNNEDGPYFDGAYYPPLLESIPSIKKSVDPLFFGLLKYSIGAAVLINTDGSFDDWRSRNLFGQPARFLTGDVGQDYADFDKVFEGFISNDDRSFDDFTVAIEDPRKALTQPVATNTLNLTDWPNLSEGNVDEPKPVAYGTIRNAKAICLNEEASGSPARIFLIADTEFNLVDSLDAIYVDGVETALSGTADLTAGTFTMTHASVADNLDSVTISFTATDFDNGVEIIKDLMLNYDSKSFIASFWDLDEVNAAELESRDTSLYIDSGSKKLSDVIESVANDTDARFFSKNSGVLTIRIYDEDRTPNAKELINDEWQNYPKIKNNGSEYLSSVIIEYFPDLENDESYTYENLDFQTETFNRYKKLKSTTFKTQLPTLADAVDKSNTIMNISKEVQDIASRTTSWDNFGIEPTDFLIGSPTSRDNAADIRAIYEVLNIKSDLDKFTITLDLRYIKDADEVVPKVYTTIDDNNDAYILDDNNDALLGRIS